MRDMLNMAGFTDIKIQAKENAADLIKDWMPGSGAEKYVTSAYVTATKPFHGNTMRDNVRADVGRADVAVAAAVDASVVSAGC